MGLPGLTGLTGLAVVGAAEELVGAGADVVGATDEVGAVVLLLEGASVLSPPHAASAESATAAEAAMSGRRRLDRDELMELPLSVGMSVKVTRGYCPINGVANRV